MFNCIISKFLYCINKFLSKKLIITKNIINISIKVIINFMDNENISLDAKEVT